MGLVLINNGFSRAGFQLRERAPAINGLVDNLSELVMKLAVPPTGESSLVVKAGALPLLLECLHVSGGVDAHSIIDLLQLELQLEMPEAAHGTFSILF